MKHKLFLIMIMIIFFSTVIFAHQGKTDSKGGHYDRSAGEYHYHHGYPAHKHKDGVCPYNYDDKTSNRSSSSSSSSVKNSTSSKADNNTNWWAIIIAIGYFIFLIFLFSG